MGLLQIHVVDKLEDFEALSSAWNELLDISLDRHVFLTWEWQFTWWKHFGQGRQLNIVLVKDSGRIVAIAPLMRNRLEFGPNGP